MNEQNFSAVDLQQAGPPDNSCRQRRRWLPAFTLIILGLMWLGATSCQTAPESSSGRTEEEKHFAIPYSLVAEHEELHRQLQDTINSGGETGQAAKLVADRLRPHFAKEEEYALPPLTLLGPLSQDRFDSDMGNVMMLSEKMSAELPQMLTEHKAIIEALDRLVDAAKKEDKVAAIEFSERLRQHARSEEEILYPSAILVGKYLKLRIEHGTQFAR